MRFKDLKIGTKQGLGFSLILVILAGVSSFSIYQLQAIRDEIDVVNENWLPRVVAISNVNLHASVLRIYQLQHALTDDAAQEAALVGAMLDAIDEINAHRDRYERVDTLFSAASARGAEEERLYAAFDEGWEEYQDQFLTLLTLYENGQKGAAVALLNGAAGEVYDAFSTDLKDLVDLTRSEAAAAVRRTEATYVATRDITMALLVGTILLSALFAVGLVRYITVPVRALERAAGLVAQGDLDVRVPTHTADEMGSLAKSFNQMTQSLWAAREQTQRQEARLRAQREELQQTNRALEEKSRSLERQKAEIERKNRDLEHALQQLKEAQQQLVIREKMASLGQLTAGIAHEIKNPLNFVNNFAAVAAELSAELCDALRRDPDRRVGEVLGDVEALSADLQLAVAKIEAHGRRADGIVRGMLLHSRGKPGERQETALNDFVDDYVNLAYHGMRATQPAFNVTIERAYDEDAGVVSLVPQDMGRVLLNLLGNAFYAVHERATRDGEGYTPWVQVGTGRGADGVEIRVHDNGFGVPPALRARIFEPFFTTKPTGEGTGLGLSLSYDIVTQSHGGSLDLEAVDGEGALFVVRLPA